MEPSKVSAFFCLLCVPPNWECLARCVGMYLKCSPVKWVLPEEKKKTASISFSLANIYKHPHTHTHTIAFSFAFSIWIAKGHREGKGIKKKHKRSHHCLETLSTTKKKKSTAGCSSSKLSCESAHTAHSQTKPYSMLLFLFPSSSWCGLSCSFLQRGYIHTYIYIHKARFSLLPQKRK